MSKEIKETNTHGTKAGQWSARKAQYLAKKYKTVVFQSLEKLIQRSDALSIKVFYKKCAQAINCKVTETSGNIVTELKKKILKKAAIYAEETKKKSKDNKYNAPKDWND